MRLYIHQPRDSGCIQRILTTTRDFSIPQDSHCHQVLAAPPPQVHKSCTTWKLTWSPMYRKESLWRFDRKSST